MARRSIGGTTEQLEEMTFDLELREGPLPHCKCGQFGIPQKCDYVADLDCFRHHGLLECVDLPRPERTCEFWDKLGKTSDEVWDNILSAREGMPWPQGWRLV